MGSIRGSIYDEYYDELGRVQQGRWMNVDLPRVVKKYGAGMQAFLRVFGDDADDVYHYLRDEEEVKPTDYYLIHPTNPEE